MMKDNALYGKIDNLTGKLIDAGSKEELELKQLNDKIRIVIGESYEDILNIISNYIDISEEKKKILTLWTLGTYLHNEFEAFPYLYLNAMRGSAKTRTLKLITKLSKDGRIMCSPTEATLFRTNGTLGIDEFEDVAKKGKAEIRELLNGAYKKGMRIIRMRKIKTIEGEKQTPEEFETFRPIVMANISGMEEVLGDRSISVVLEKSQNQIYTKKIEDFETNPQILAVIDKLRQIFDKNSDFSVVSVGVYLSKNIHTRWNQWINERYSSNTTQYTLTTPNYTNTQKNENKNIKKTDQIKLEKLFLKLDNANIQGRDFELFLPFFLIANLISEKVLDEIIEIAKNYVKGKKQEQGIESRDIMLMDFVSRLNTTLDYYPIKRLTNEFKGFVECDDDEDKWLNTLWVGSALKRLNLVIDKRRVSTGMEVILNISKAKEKLKMFKSEEK